MDRQQIGLKLTLDVLGLPARLSSFEDRLVLQKTIYLAQIAGVQLGYHFSWYLRGPYSPALTRDAFAVVAELDQGVDDSEGSNLDTTSLERLEKLRRMMERIPSADRPAELELLGSVHFLLGTPAAQGKDASELRAILNRYGKCYSLEQIQHAIEELKEHGLRAASSSR